MERGGIKRDGKEKKERMRQKKKVWLVREDFPKEIPQSVDQNLLQGEKKKAILIKSTGELNAS